jgi:hypothetical protein
MTLSERAIECATRSIGVKENPSNWGRWVSAYLKFVGIFFPAPWCAAFVAYKINQAASELGVKSRWPKYGYVQSVVNWAKKQPVGSIRLMPYPNSVFVSYSNDLKRYSHIGFIKAVVKEDGLIKIITIEGNSNKTGSREGTEVVSIKRIWSERYRCLRIV